MTNFVVAFAASGSLADPMGSSPLVAAVSWLEGTILGTVATTVALIAIAAVGFMMLSGRIQLRRGASVILGCFILFGAPGIAAGLQNLASDSGDPAYSPLPPLESSPLANVPEPSPPPADYDPYAGASLRPR